MAGDKGLQNWETGADSAEAQLAYRLSFSFHVSLGDVVRYAKELVTND